jgi:hypothetical protein
MDFPTNACLLKPNVLMTAAPAMQGYKSTVVIYDAHDPFLFAANLTQGGMVLAEDRVNEVALGITSCVFGFVLMVPFLLLKIIALFMRRHDDSEPFDDIPLYACEVENH